MIAQYFVAVCGRFQCSGNHQFFSPVITVSPEHWNAACITLYFCGRKISRKVNLKYFREKIFSRIYCSRENIFPRKYLPAKISSRENILAKISSRENRLLFRHRSFLFAVCCPVIGDTGSRPNVRSSIRIRPAQQWHNSFHFESRSFL